eukprot:Hpha_TRINITY_DN17755_c0_g1::TRINITY_DN17755_c0_g1_i1::g.46385::m.46385
MRPTGFGSPESDGSGQAADVIEAAGIELCFDHNDGSAVALEFHRILEADDAIALGDLVTKVPLRALASKTETPLHLAARAHAPGCVRVLLAYGADPMLIDESGLRPVSAAMAVPVSGTKAELEAGVGRAARRLQTVDALLTGAPNAARSGDFCGWTPVHQAAGDGDSAVLRLMTSRCPGVVRVRSSKGVSPLHVAARRGCVRSAGALLAAGAKPNVTCDEGWTPLHSAALTGAPRVVRILTSSGADVDARSTQGATPLHVAAASGSRSCALALQQWGADTAAQLPHCGSTPAHLAAKRAHA